MRETVSEREPERSAGESATQQQASMPQNAAESVHARAWEMHLSGIPKVRIARALALDRETVSRYIRACYAEVASERRMTLARKLDGAIARWRRVQEQAWADHDEDDQREMQALEYSLGRQGGARGKATMRYQSQRSRYLRVILDAEKEIARLEGLYEGWHGDGGEVVFHIVKGTQGEQ
jgi:hypothetical protein